MIYSVIKQWLVHDKRPGLFTLAITSYSGKFLLAVETVQIHGPYKEYRKLNYIFGVFLQ